MGTKEGQPMPKQEPARTGVDWELGSGDVLRTWETGELKSELDVRPQGVLHTAQPANALASVIALANELRAAQVEKGLIKGSA